MNHQDTFVSNQPAIKDPNSFYDFFAWCRYKILKIVQERDDRYVDEYYY